LHGERAGGFRDDAARALAPPALPPRARRRGLLHAERGRRAAHPRPGRRPAAGPGRRQPQVRRRRRRPAARRAPPRRRARRAAHTVERLIAGGAALRVSSAESLAWALAGLLDEPARMADMGRRARALVEGGQGAVERHLKIIAARLSMTRFSRATG